MRLALDVDGVIANFVAGLFARAGLALDLENWITKFEFLEDWSLTGLWEKVQHDEQFWLSLPVVDSHIPRCCVLFLSDRPVETTVTERWLNVNNIRHLPIYHVKDKLEFLRKSDLDGLVDDKGETYEQVRNEFPASFLVSRPWNRWVKTRNRIYRLEELDWRESHE